MILTNDFKEFIASLNENNVKYLIVDGYAVAFHGNPRYTTAISGMEFEKAFEHRIETEIDGVTVAFIACASWKLIVRKTFPTFTSLVVTKS